MPELINCPFCGRKMKLTTMYDPDLEIQVIGHDDSSQELCPLYRGLTWFGTAEEATYLWNKRAMPAERHGKWVFKREELWGEPVEGYSCSICGTRWPKSRYGRKNYCPGCGAKMDEGNSDEAELTLNIVHGEGE